MNNTLDKKSVGIKTIRIISLKRITDRFNGFKATDWPL